MATNVKIIVMQKIIIKSMSSNVMSISGYASVFNNLDKQGDVILTGAFGVDINSKASEVKFLWQHNPSHPIGIIKSLHADSYGLFIEAEINLSTAQGREAEALLQQGALDSFSIGFLSKEAAFNKLGYREIKSLDLLEISIVTFPANPSAQIHFMNKKQDQINLMTANLDKIIQKIQTL